MNTPRKRRDGARPAVPPDVELRPTGDPPSDVQSALDQSLVAPSWLPKDLAGLYAEVLARYATRPSDLPPWRAATADEQSAPDPNARQKRLASKAAYRMRNREKERERTKEWRRNNPDQVRARKAKIRADNYFRHFVAIDSEGQDYAGDDIRYQGVRYPRHDTYLWAAAADDGREPVWLTAAETHGMNKRALSGVEILDWLLDLRRQYKKAVFIMFSFKYDIAQIIRHVDYFTAWKIYKHETHSAKTGVVFKIDHSPVFGRKVYRYLQDG